MGVCFVTGGKSQYRGSAEVVKATISAYAG